MAQVPLRHSANWEWGEKNSDMTSRLRFLQTIDLKVNPASVLGCRACERGNLPLHNLLPSVCHGAISKYLKNK